MKKIVLSLAVIATMTLASCGNKNADKVTTTTEQEVATEKGEKFNVNLTDSYVTWKVGHKGGLDPRFGKISLQSGDIAVDASGLNAGNYVMDMNTIAVDRESVSKDEDVAKLEGHLKNADFFDVEKYPTVAFAITKVEDFDATKNESKIEGANKLVSGNLTILDNTVNITFPAKVTIADGKTTVEANFVAQRTDWGIKFGTVDKTGAAITPAEWGISQDMEIGIHLVADKVTE
ncbi:MULTISPECIES: YceI family protein [Myroides]|uniref:YceI family protein n=1 Tax=Myroides TaxID=76831 RepID=UPI0013034128|nr:YceI family protein [Myroides phaeus]